VLVSSCAARDTRSLGMSIKGDIPWVTWLSGGAALLLVIGTGVLLLSGRTPPAPGAVAMPTAMAKALSVASAASASVPQPSAQAPDRHPLDISLAQGDARTRASLHFDRSALVGIRLIIDAGRPLGPIEITYARIKERALPGALVTSERLRVSYDGGRATPTEDTDRTSARSVPEPNCPLEAAFRAAVQAGASADARTFAVYAHSQRHDRPTWTLTAGSGGAYHVDGDNCALLRR
jgi:hypothetical protein